MFLERFHPVIHTEIHEKSFAAYRILLALDLGGGTCSYEGYELLRKVETRGVKYQRGILKSQHVLQCLARKLEAYAMTLVDVTFTQTSVSFNIEKSLPLLLENYGLWELVEHGSEDVTIAVMMDGAELSWKVGQVLVGMKITDP